MPDPQLTPGAVADTNPAVVCAPGYSRSHRVWHDKIGTLAKYGIPPSEAGAFDRGRSGLRAEPILMPHCRPLSRPED
jgi:hypothetical protein